MQILWARHLDSAHSLKVRHDGTKSLKSSSVSLLNQCEIILQLMQLLSKPSVSVLETHTLSSQAGSLQRQHFLMRLYIGQEGGMFQPCQGENIEARIKDWKGIG